MIEVLALVLAAVAAFFAYTVWKRNNERRDPPLPGNRAKHPDDRPVIQNVIPGGVIRIERLGPDMRDVDVQVVARHLYEEDGFTWFELDGETADGKLYLTVVDDDELEMSVSGGKLTLLEVGLKPEQFQGSGKPPAQIAYDGLSFRLVEQGDVTFYRNSDRLAPEPFRYWDYADKQKKRMLTVERWGASSFEVHDSAVVNPRQVIVYATRGDQGGVAA